MSTIRVTLAEVPTDVLVYLVDHGPATFDAIVDAVAPKDADDPRRSVALALSLLIEGNWVSSGGAWHATVDGCKAVALAREQATA